MAQILDAVLEEFTKLAAIPRPSKHEEAVSNFLRDYLKEMGVDVEQDESLNIIAEIPATAGHETAPLTILQAHMDMVCVAEAGYEYDAHKDAIKLIRGDKYLEAEGTSLGADDGLGVAEILYIVKNRDAIDHGRLRVIFTTDEEQGMTGALNLDAKYLKGADFLINCDSEIFDELIIGSAGNVHVDFAREINYVAPNSNFTTALRIRISGLSGGHSGIEIAKSRANAVKVMENFLRVIRSRGNFQLAEIMAGTAPNVIPSVAEVVVVTDLAEMEVAEIGADFGESVKAIFGEADFKIEMAPVPVPDKVLSVEDFESVAGLIEIIHSGVYRVDGEAPVTSANIGVVRSGASVTVKVLARSNISALLKEFVEIFARIGRVTGFDVKFGAPVPAWDTKPDSRLAKIMTDIFTKQNGYAPSVHTSHGGLECSLFAAKNPALDIVSTGTTNEFIHSPNERLHLVTVAPHVRLIVETLAQIAK